MITPNEIKDQCLKWWREILVTAIDDGLIFPREIARIGKIGSKDILAKLNEYKTAIEILKEGSKENKPAGYKILFTERQFDKIGLQQIPDRIIIESLEDYLKLTAKGKDYDIFLVNLNLIRSELPSLLGWIRNNPLKLVEHNSWKEILQVCKYFIANPNPNLYVRQIPIDIHTKFIQNNRALIESLLEYLIPDNVKFDESRFELRFNLKYAEPLVRIRFLDRDISPISTIADMSLPLSEFALFNCECQTVFVSENLMNFLTLPALPKAIAIWSGGGFNVGYLKDIQWLKCKQFYYWGDIDAHGFQILNQFRSYFPNTVSVMMDKETLDKFIPGSGKASANQNLRLLNENELWLYKLVREKNIRLEQEKITQVYAENKIKSLFT